MDNYEKLLEQKRAILSETKAKECQEYKDEIERLRAELTAARARLAELQAVCDAAVKYSNAHHLEVGSGYKFYCVDKQADDEFDAALSRGVVEFKPIELSEKDKEFIRQREAMERMIADGYKPGGEVGE